MRHHDGDRERRLRWVNLRLLGAGLVLIHLLVGKMVLDILAYRQVRPSFRFPGFFLPLVGFCLCVSVAFSVIILRGAYRSLDRTPAPFDRWDGLLWLALPLSVLCISPICYVGHILQAPYLLGTLQRWALLLLPPVALFWQLRQGRDRAALLLLLVGFFALLPNDRCFNPFNHRWIALIGASPLTYILSVYLLLFVVGALYHANKAICLIAAYGLCAISLLMSLGHRMRFLW